MAYDIFDNYINKLLEENFNDFDDMNDDIYIEALTEASMSIEDRHDSDILKSIIDKTRERTNAKLTQEERDILAKYGLERRNQAVILPGKIQWYVTSDEDIGNPRGGNVRERRSGRSSDPYHNDPNEVNYADIARKRGARDDARRVARESDTLYQWNQDRAHMRDYLRSRKYHQRQVDQGDDEYQKALEKARKEYELALSQAEHQRDQIDTYHQPQLDKAQASIDALLKRQP